jgi:flavoprotein
LNFFEKISDGKGVEDDLDHLRRISNAMKKASLCGLGQTVPNPVLSTLNYFEAEYKAHVVDKRCPAGRCGALMRYSIIQEKCRKCGLCVRSCAPRAILGDREKGYDIDESKCIRCGQCFEVCKFNAILKS